MTYSAHTFQLDSLLLDEPRYIVERVKGTAAIAGRRRQSRTVAYRHGEWDDENEDPYFAPKALSLLVSVHSVDEYGERTESPYSHLRENWDDLAAVLGKRGRVDVRQFIPYDPDESGTDPIELQNYARIGSQIEIAGDALVWKTEIELEFPWPFWHELPQISRTSATSHAITTGGTAPIADMVLTFAGDGTLSDDLGLGHEITISGSSGPVVVDVGAREVTQAGVLAMSLLRLGDSAPENWMEWPARSTVNLTSDVGVAVAYYNARH